MTTPEACENFEKMALDRGRPDLAVGARRRAIDLRVAEKRPSNDLERECFAVIVAYERVLSDKNGRRTQANRTWQLIKSHGVIGAIKRAVDRNDDPSGYTTLVDLGLQEYTFEALVLRHQSLFSPEVVRRSAERLSSRSNG